MSILLIQDNQFSIQLKFWQAETKGVSTVSSNTIYIDIVDTRHKDLLCIQCYLCRHCQIKSLKCVRYSMLSMPTLSIQSIKWCNVFNTIYVNTVDTIELQCRF